MAAHLMPFPSKSRCPGGHPVYWPGPDEDRPGPEGAQAPIRLTHRALSSFNIHLEVAATVVGAFPDPTGSRANGNATGLGDGCERLKTPRSKGQEDDGLVISVQIFPFSLEKKRTQMTAKVLEYYMICETCLFILYLAIWSLALWFSTYWANSKNTNEDQRANTKHLLEKNEGNPCDISVTSFLRWGLKNLLSLKDAFSWVSKSPKVSWPCHSQNLDKSVLASTHKMVGLIKTCFSPQFSIIKKKKNSTATWPWTLIFICLLQSSLFTNHSEHCKPW